MAYSKNAHLHSLDGVRGMAAIFVVLSHNCYFFTHDTSLSIPVEFREPLGYLGVLIFFVLSSFLLTSRTIVSYRRLQTSLQSTPFRTRVAKLAWFWAKYILMRLLRIYPLLTAYLIFVKLVYLPDLNIWNCFILKEAPTTLWTLRVEIGFYLCIPVICVVYDLLVNAEHAFRIATKTAFCVITVYLLHNYQWTNGYGYGYFIVFFTGSLIGLLYFEMQRESPNIVLRLLDNPVLSQSFGILSFGLLILITLLQFPHTQNILSHFVPSLRQYIAFQGRTPVGYMVGFLASLMVLMMVLSPDSLFSKAMCSQFFKFYGKISFSLYIAHLMYFDYGYQLRGRLNAIAGNQTGEFFTSLDCSGNFLYNVGVIISY